jgi:hypothetical protein
MDLGEDKTTRFRMHKPACWQPGFPAASGEKLT